MFFPRLRSHLQNKILSEKRRVPVKIFLVNAKKTHEELQICSHLHKGIISRENPIFM